MDEARLAAARALHREGQPAKALEAYRDLLELEPGRGDVWYLRSLAEQALGRPDESRASADRALAIEPDHPHFLLHSGHLAHDAGDLERAARELARVAELRPEWAPAWASLGAVHLDAERADDAVACLERAAALDPNRAKAWNNLGFALLGLDRRDEARSAFERALSLEPGFALARLNLARALEAGGDAPGALAQADEARRLAPRNPEAHLMAGDLCRKRRDAAGALERYQSAVAANPALPRARNALAEMLWEAGAIDAARREFEANRRDHPGDLKAALGSALLLPAVYAGKDDLARCRESYRQGLHDLQERSGDFSWKRAQDALADMRWTNFYLAYQGRNDRELQSLYGDFIRGLLRRAAPGFVEGPARRVREGARLRVGFLSHFFFNCTAGRYFASWVRGLDASRFETFVYYTNPLVADDTRAIAASAAHFRHVASRTVHDIARQVLADELDILVYPELGMHADSFALGSLRLAPVQCAGWGHPTTTGLPSIDWFLSCESMEPEAAQACYRERLALLPGLGTNYARPAGETGGERADFSLPADRHLYLVPQSVFKIHPDNDGLIADVLAADPAGIAVFFAAGAPAHVEAFAKRIAPALAVRGLSVERNLLFLPFLTHGEYLRVNRLCDVMLDTLHWSGGNTSLDAIAMGLPVVTLPGGLMRGRQSAGMLRILGLEELVARDESDYVRIAVGVASDRDRRESISRRMGEGSVALFDQQGPVEAFADFLEAAARGAGEQG